MPTNTEYERIAIDEEVNLSDGHARMPLSGEQIDILANLSDVIASLDRAPQTDVEERFINSFYKLSNIDSEMAARSPTYFSYSSSCSIKIVSQVIREKGWSVSLIEPCFDNIRHILVSQGVTVKAFQESWLYEFDMVDKEEFGDAIWLVLPNNPTGATLSRETFVRILEWSASNKKAIIVDACFRFFSPSMLEWDMLRELEESRVDYCLIEDTGKTWNAFDLKVGFVKCSPSLEVPVHRFHDELLLNVSPLILDVLNRFIRISIRDGLKASLYDYIGENRYAVNKLVQSGVVERCSPHLENVPMEFLELSNSVSAIDLWSRLREKSINILPAHNYYWSDRRAGANRFRIPLSRPHSHIHRAVETIFQIL